MTDPRLRLPALLGVLSLLALAACGPRSVREPPTVALLDIGPAKNREYSEWTVAALEAFTRETGIEVKRVFAPESSNEQLVFERRLLEGGAPRRESARRATMTSGATCGRAHRTKA